jgi:hypothetical protein
MPRLITYLLDDDTEELLKPYLESGKYTLNLDLNSETREIIEAIRAGRHSYSIEQWEMLTSLSDKYAKYLT